MRPSVKMLPGIALAFVSSMVGAQATLGELLDGGAKRLSVEQFKREVVQRTIVGSSNTGALFELMYVANGSIAGRGGNPLDTSPYRQNVPVSGEWTIDETDRICTAMTISPSQGGVTTLPRRCQYWFKLADAYYISDSDSDRQAKVLRRSLKPASASAGIPRDLGQLLNAGARKLSTAEFRHDVVGQTLVGSSPLTGELEIMYLANGALQATGTGAGYTTPLFMTLVSWTGDWKSDEFERVCVEMRSVPYGTAKVLPRQCQAWFKLGDDYYIADSDSDRRAIVWRRVVKR